MPAVRHFVFLRKRNFVGCYNIINVKKLQSIHIVNGDGWKPQKSLKGNVNHTNIA